jgi:hypothetical protein
MDIFEFCFVPRDLGRASITVASQTFTGLFMIIGLLFCLKKRFGHPGLIFVKACIARFLKMGDGIRHC